MSSALPIREAESTRETESFWVRHFVKLAVLLIGLIVTPFAISSMLKSRIAANEQNAAMSLNTLKNVQASWRESDFDGNRVKDFWTLDVAGLYGHLGPDGQPVKQIQLGLAKADAAPGQAYAHVPTTGVARSGYLFAALATDVDGNNYALDVDGDGEAFTNQNLFGFTCYPARYGTTGRRTYILGEEGQVYGHDTGGGAENAPIQWPADDPTTSGHSSCGGY